MALSPEARAHLAEVAQRLDAAGHAEKGRIIDEVVQFYGWSRSKLYAALKREVGWHSGRKTRADKGTTCVPVANLEMLAAIERESLRANGKQIMHTPTGASVLVANAVDLPVSNSQLNRLMRQRKLNVAAQRKADAPVRMRSLHPNHVHQVDPSLCVLYYLPDGRQAMMDADKFYKNKLSNYAKIKLKVWRYVLYDHTSGLIAVRYFETAGESQAILAEFLLWAWGKQEGREFHGVPRLLVWDKGSANTSATIKNLLEALEVQPIEHAPGAARVKGGVENANNLVEIKFESRLKLEPVHSAAQLNDAAFAWQNAFNADLIPREENALRRRGMLPVARYHLWRRISAEQLRVLPDVAACRALLEGKEVVRVVRDMLISFKHPQADRARSYKVAGLDGICNGDEVAVRPLLYGDCAIHLRAACYDGADRVYRLEAEPLPDEYGFPLDAQVWNEGYKAQPQTEADRAAKRMDELAYPDRDAQGVARAREQQKTPFLRPDGTPLNAHSHLQDVDLPLGLPRRGQSIHLPERLQIEAKPLNCVQIATLLSKSVADWSAAHFACLQQLFPAGALEAELDQVAERVQQAVSGPGAGEQGRAHLVAVS